MKAELPHGRNPTAKPPEPAFGIAPAQAQHPRVAGSPRRLPGRCLGPPRARSTTTTRSHAAFRTMSELERPTTSNRPATVTVPANTPRLRVRCGSDLAEAREGGWPKARGKPRCGGAPATSRWISSQLVIAPSAIDRSRFSKIASSQRAGHCRWRPRRPLPPNFVISRTVPRPPVWELHRSVVEPAPCAANGDGPIECRERLGGLLRYYHREAA